MSDWSERICINRPFHVRASFRSSTRLSALPLPPSPPFCNTAGRTQTGELTAIVGPSGSGKTTLLECISLRNRRFEGNVYVDGAPPAGDIFTMSGACAYMCGGLCMACCARAYGRTWILICAYAPHPPPPPTHPPTHPSNAHTHNAPAIVHQKELLFGYMTPREYLIFNARARMARGYTATQRERRVNEVRQIPRRSLHWNR
jgi:ABC-type cobalamin/Fe3+-siderophores transport system ATPase subunit